MSWAQMSIVTTLSKHVLLFRGTAKLTKKKKSNNQKSEEIIILSYWEMNKIESSGAEFHNS